MKTKTGEAEESNEEEEVDDDEWGEDEDHTQGEYGIFLSNTVLICRAKFFSLF